METVWDRIYEEEEDYATDLEKLRRQVPLLKKEGCRRILDVGCGSGAHMLLLAREGFEVSGVDISRKALEIARKRFKKAGLHADFHKIDIYEDKFPFPDKFFDAVISFNVLHHNRITKIRRALAEIARVVRKGGLFMATLYARKPRKRMHRSRFLDKYTFVPLEGREAGVIHHIFTRKKIERELEKWFKIERIETLPDRWWPRAYYFVMGRRK